MLNFTQARAIGFGIAMATLLSACGGSDGSSSPADPNPSAAVVSSFSSAYSAGLANLASYAGLTSASLADLFDGAFLDSGLTKADVMAALQSEAQAAAVSPDFPSFAQVAVSGISITNCDATTQLCTLTGTLTNSDADTTSVPFTTQVKLSDKARLYGDQSKS